MMKRVATYIAIVLAFSFLMTGCAPKEKNICHVNPKDWSNSANIFYENNQLDTYLDISFFVRCNNDFDVQAVPIIIQIEAPDSSIAFEHATWVFDGEKAPTPTASIQKIGYRSTCALNQRGTYKFSITPMYSIKGVEAVGLIVENNKGLYYNGER